MEIAMQGISKAFGTNQAFLPAYTKPMPAKSPLTGRKYILKTHATPKTTASPLSIRN